MNKIQSLFALALLTVSPVAGRGTPTAQLTEMTEKAEEMLKYYRMSRRLPVRQSGGNAPSPIGAL